MVSYKYSTIHADGLLFALDPEDFSIQSVSQTAAQFIFKRDPSTLLQSPFLDLLEQPREFVIFLDNHFCTEEDSNPVPYQSSFRVEPGVLYDLAVHCPMMEDTRYIIVEVDISPLIQREDASDSSSFSSLLLHHPRLPDSEPLEIPYIQNLLLEGQGFLMTNLMNDIEEMLHACPDRKTLYLMIVRIFRRLLHAEHTHLYTMYDDTSKKVVGVDNDPACEEKYISVTDRFLKQIPTYMSRSYTQKYVISGSEIRMFNHLPTNHQEIIGERPLPLHHAIYRYPNPLVVKLARQFQNRACIVSILGPVQDFRGGLVSWFPTPRQFSFKTREFISLLNSMFCRAIGRMFYQEYFTSPLELLSISPDASISSSKSATLSTDSQKGKEFKEDGKSNVNSDSKAAKTVPERAVASEMQPIFSTTMEYLSTVSRQLMSLFWADAVIIYAHDTLEFVTHLNHDETLNPIGQYFINAKINQLFTTSRVERDLVADSRLGYSLPASDEFTSTAALVYIPLKETGDAFLIFLRRSPMIETESSSNSSEEYEGSLSDTSTSPPSSINAPPNSGGLLPASSWTEQQMSMSNLMCVTFSWFLMMQEERANSRYSDIMTDLMLGNLTHEFRTPIHTIMNFVEMLLEEYSSNDTKTLSILKEARETTDILLGLVNDILFLASLKTSRVQSSYAYHFSNQYQPCRSNLSGESVDSDGRLHLSEYFSYLWESLESNRAGSGCLDVKVEPNVDDALEGVVVSGPIKPFQYGLSCLLRNAIKWTGKGVVKVQFQREDLISDSDVDGSIVHLRCQLDLISRFVHDHDENKSTLNNTTETNHSLTSSSTVDPGLHDQSVVESNQTVLAILKRLVSAFEGYHFSSMKSLRVLTISADTLD